MKKDYMTVEISNEVRLGNIPSSFADAVKAELTIPFPQYVEYLGVPWNTENLSEGIEYYKEVTPDELIIPSGFTSNLLQMAEGQGIKYQIKDKRRTLQPVEFEFDGMLNPAEEKGLKDCLANDFGVLNAPKGSGKTVMALAAIAARKQPCLVVVHSKPLLLKWLDQAPLFLTMDREEIGIFGDGYDWIGDRLTIGIADSVYPIAGAIKDYFGFLVLDECENCSEWTFGRLVNEFDCRYKLGLASSALREDGYNSKLMNFYLGDEIHYNDVECLSDKITFVHDYLEFLNKLKQTENVEDGGK